jgi:hypothetical protein
LKAVIYDLSGKKLWDYFMPGAAPGKHKIQIAIRRPGFSALVPGLYVLTIEQKNNKLSKTVAVQR